MNLDEVVVALDAVAPLRLAGSWDNVGVLIDGERPIHAIGVCVDLTEPVLDELLAAGSDLIVAYHPPWFAPLKRLRASVPREQTLLRLIRAGIHLYSPHSALDAARGGMADWLLEPFAVTEVAPITPDPLDPTVGAGRIARCVAPVALADLIGPVRRHLGLEAVRVAGDEARPLRSIAVCPGAGGSLFERARADLLLTGELGHHAVLAQVERGGAVLLTDHTHTERGYLPRYAARITAATGLPTRVAAACADPLRIRR